MKFEEWKIAFRKISNRSLLIDGNKEEFRIINNTWRYWCADPHLYEYKDEHYLFAELYDRVLRRGVIGYCKISESANIKWKVALKMPYHLSYPNVFSFKEKIYMIPESYVANEIAVFEAISFPDKWKKVHVIAADIIAVDTTLVDNDLLLTYRLDAESNELVVLSVAERGKIIASHAILDIEENKRPAGKIFVHNEHLIRPSQDCSKGYGCALNFYDVKEIESGFFDEELIKKISPGEISVDMKESAEGIHTYNFDSKYEVIDLKYYRRCDLLFYIMRPIWFVWRRVKRVFNG